VFVQQAKVATKALQDTVYIAGALQHTRFSRPTPTALMMMTNSLCATMPA
jgi:hypothetical protein